MTIFQNNSFVKLLLVISLTFTFLTPGSARGDESNMGFENDDTEGWTVTTEGATLTAGTVTGEVSLPEPILETLVSPTEGSHFFVFDMGGPSSAVVTKELADIFSLDLDVIYINQALFTLYANDGNALNITDSNQWLRVDVLRPGAISTSLDPEDIMFTLWDSNPYVGEEDVFSGVWQTLTSPGSFSNGVLRMITVNTNGFLTVGLDNLRITGISNASVPELPQTDFWTALSKDKATGTLTISGSFEKKIKVVSVFRENGSYDNLSTENWEQASSQLTIKDTRPSNPITSIQIFNGALPLFQVINVTQP